MTGNSRDSGGDGDVIGILRCRASCKGHNRAEPGQKPDGESVGVADGSGLVSDCWVVPQGTQHNWVKVVL